MIRDDIIRMAREAGIDDWWDSGNEHREVLQEHLELFATLVAAAERDRMCEQFNISKELAHEKTKGNETD